MCTFFTDFRAQCLVAGVWLAIMSLTMQVSLALGFFETKAVKSTAIYESLAF